MDKKKQGKAGKSSLDTFLTFWSTLPGILTGIAAVIAAITGLYLAFGPREKVNRNEPSPTPFVSPAPTSPRSVSDGVWDKCFEPEFAGVPSIEVGTGEHFLKPQDGVVRIKLTDGHQPLGAVTLKHYSDDDVHFEVRKVVDSKCGPIDVEENKLINDAWLKGTFGGQKYELRLMYHGGRFSTEFVKP
jgi:hypothetical protein